MTFKIFQVKFMPNTRISSTMVSWKSFLLQSNCMLFNLNIVMRSRVFFREYFPEVLWAKSIEDRVIKNINWRSKQNLDYAYLLMFVHAQKHCDYFLHLGDDIITKPKYTEAVQTHLQDNGNKSWFSLEFDSFRN